MKNLVVLVIAAFLLTVFALPAVSQSPDSVDAKVTPLFLSVTIQGGAVDFGVVPLSVADDQRSLAVQGPVKVKNTGSVNADFKINASDATSPLPGNSTWVLSCDSPNGSVTTNQFVLKFGAASSLPFNFVAAGELLCPVGQTQRALASGVSPEGEADFVLELAMPTGSTGYAERTTQIVVTALQSQ